MKKSQIAAQLFSFRNFIKTPEAVEETFRKLHEIGYEAVQLSSSLAPMPEERLGELLDKYQLVPCTSHEQAGMIVDETEKVIEHLKKLNVTHVAYPSPHIPLNSLSETVAWAKLLNDRAIRFKEAGITLAYHNHHVEFCRFGEKTILELLYENAPEIEGEIDTFWVQRGGGSPVEWIQRLDKRMKVLHIKDYGLARKEPDAFWSVDCVMRSIGDGTLNWNAILETAEKCGVEWFVVEHDGNCPDPFASFQTSLEFLKKHFVTA